MAVDRSFAVILCRYKEDQGVPPVKSREYFEEMFAGKDSASIADYWKDMSRGNVNLYGTKVFGWYFLPYTRAEQKAVTDTMKVHGEARRWLVENAMRVAVNNGVDLNKFYGVIAIYEYKGDLGSVGTISVSINGSTYSLPAIILDQASKDKDTPIPIIGGWQHHAVSAHEVGHALGLGHSYGYDVLWDGKLKEYLDPWDIMSAGNIYTFSSKYGPAGPGLNAALLETQGWLAESEIWCLNGGPNCKQSGTHSVTLNPLHQLSASGIKVAKIFNVPHQVSADNNDWEDGYYSIEYRSGDGWDTAFAEDWKSPSEDVVLIHWVGNDAPWSKRSILMPYLKHGYQPRTILVEGDSFFDKASNLRIDVTKIVKNKSAQITFSPLPTVVIETDTETTKSNVVFDGSYTYPGIPHHCQPKSFAAKSIQQYQTISAYTSVFELKSPLKVSISIGDQSLNKNSGVVSFLAETQIPDLSSGANTLYKKQQKMVQIEYLRSDNSIQLKNRPEDGTYAFRLDVHVVDAKGMEANAFTVVKFSGWIVEFEDGFNVYASACLMSAIAEFIKLEKKTIPVETGDEPSPIGVLTRIDPTGRNIITRSAIEISLERVHMAATALYGPLFEETFQPQSGLRWVELGLEPERARWRDVIREKKGRT